jgi:hypothetical protein
MTTNQTAHSADVKMHVVRNGSKLSVSQLGPDFLVLEKADDISGAAELILSVDGWTRKRQVQLQATGAPDEKKILFP